MELESGPYPFYKQLHCAACEVGWTQGEFDGPLCWICSCKGYPGSIHFPGSKIVQEEERADAG